MADINLTEKVTRIENTMRYNLIYVFRIDDTEHSGCLKIGKATAPDLPLKELLVDNCDALQTAARARIDSYTSTAGVIYELLYTTLAVRKDEHGRLESFMDKKVHNVLLRSGYSKKTFKTSKKQTEWFVCDLDKAIKAINAVKNHQQSLDPYDTTKYVDPIIFRPEQKEAIERTVKHFKKGNKSMLWNAKMRFGKTLSTMQVVKELGLKRSLIITHRPVVADSWYEDFGKIFFDPSGAYLFGSRNKGESIDRLEKLAKQNKCRYIYFASMQDLRGSEKVGGKFAKNEKLFDVDWDLVIVDEAHEGTQTTLAQEVFGGIVKKRTHVLGLSGTPFNLLSKYTQEEIYTWDYVMEQEAKAKWDSIHEGDPNPYEDLPRLKIYTYDLKEIIKNALFGEDGGEVAFNFREFFRVNEQGEFIHRQDVLNFLNLLTDESEVSKYPFSNNTYRDYFRHSFWIVPGVKEGAALAKLLRQHPVFSAFDDIINVAGNEENDNALDAVREAITDNPDETRTITISCGKLTTGVNVPAWTAVLYLAGSFSTAAASYMQTIFRIQTPASINGKTKEECYVFDFAPDRTLKVIAETAKISSKAGKTTPTDRVIMGNFINYCPIISVKESTMEPFDVDGMLQKLKQVYVDRVVSSGFEDVSIYNDELLKLSDIDLEAFRDLKRKIGSTKANHRTDEIDINNQGFTEEEYEAVEKVKKKKKEELTEEDKALLEAAKEKKKARETAISILRGISIRIPLLIYGANIPYGKDLTIDNFTDDKIIDAKSWEEFMPKGVDKEVFKKFKKYYDQDIFIAAGNKIRRLAKIADDYGPTERIKRIADIFSTFRNPDKETVLTPWKVVNLHMSDTLGGYDFYDEEHKKMLAEPRFVNHRDITADVFNPQTHILEINSKTGLYPLYAAYSTFRAKCEAIKASGIQALTKEQEQEIWYNTVAENIYVICKTKMARYIAMRTLIGYHSSATNCKYIPDLLDKLKDKKSYDKLIKDLQTYKGWEKKNMEGKFDFKAVVGNPPYQGDASAQLYPHFYLMSRDLGKYSSLIFPTGWQKPCAPSAKGLARLNNEEIKADPQIRKINVLHNVFPGVSGASEVNIVFWERGFQNELGGEQLIYQDGQNPQAVQLQWDLAEVERPAELKSLAAIVKQSDFTPCSSIVSSRSPYGLNTDAFEDAQKNGLEEIVDSEPRQKDDIKIYGKFKRVNTTRYVRKSYKLPQLKEEVAATIDKYKVFIPYAWGNMAENAGLGGAYGDIIIGKPQEICTQTYVVSGCFDTKAEAVKHAKYVLTQFARALLYVKKMGRTSAKPTWEAVPVQDYSEPWWKGSVEQINEHLFDKYDVPQDIRDYVKKHIQPRSEENIRNL